MSRCLCSCEPHTQWRDSGPQRGPSSIHHLGKHFSSHCTIVSGDMDRVAICFNVIENLVMHLMFPQRPHGGKPETWFGPLVSTGSKWSWSCNLALHLCRWKQVSYVVLQQWASSLWGGRNSWNAHCACCLKTLETDSSKTLKLTSHR